MMMKTKNLTDREIIEGLIGRDNRVTGDFLFVKCRPLLTAVMRNVFDGRVEYDEMVGLLYDYLVADDCVKLRQFQYRSSLYQWLKVVATRFFLRHRDSVIDDSSNEPPYERGTAEEEDDSVGALSDRMDVASMLAMMDNRRYADAIRRLVLDGAEPSLYAQEIGVTVDNLYNIKKRAMAAFTQIAIKYYSYGR